MNNKYIIGNFKSKLIDFNEYTTIIHIYIILITLMCLISVRISQAFFYEHVCYSSIQVEV